jgi:hypothetical protein
VSTEQEINEAVLGKLEAEGLSIDSPWEKIEACLSETVRPDLCILTARRLREKNGQGILL